MSSTKGKSTKTKASETFSAEERAAMRARVREERAAARRRGKDADGESDLLAAIAEMIEPDRSMAERVHAIVKDSAPELSSRTWYGMPAYTKDDKVLCYFRNASKFKTRYATFGFSDRANLDDGGMWPTDFAVKELTAEAEARIAALVKQAVS